MLRITTAQKQYEISETRDKIHGLREPLGFEISSFIKTMMMMIKTKSKNSMNIETQMQFSKIADAVVRLVEEIRE